MKILLTNDDGVDHINIKTLYDYLSHYYKDLIICAPNKNFSASSHNMTIFDAVKLTKIKNNIYSCSGTPVDTVLIGIELFNPDVIISGPNPHLCTGFDIFRSATLAAAMQGAMLNIPSIAVAIYSDNIGTKFKQGKAGDYMLACKVIRKLLSNSKLFKNPKLILNVNVPCKADLKDVVITKCFNYDYKDRFVEVGTDCRGERWFRITYNKRIEASSGNDGVDYDIDAIRKNKISVTPITLDATDYSIIDDVKRLI